ncbi:phage major capsid protein [Burkholderia gladioli]|uniref:phage major capsid protein n=1 Tax=Burkholderia gladioli TaxID=28095 RepID=UPI00163EFEE6|nr:phage major capsid protein [Burkholderia gladioli]
MNKKIRELQARRAKATQAARALLDIAAADNDRDLNAEERTAYDAHMVDISDLTARIEREQALAAAELASGVEIPDGARIEIAENRAADPTRGFASFGEFAAAVRSAASRTRAIDERLAIGAVAPGTFGNEAGGADGGFLVPPQFSAEIFTLSLGEDSLLPMTDNVDVSGNGMVFPKDETTPWGTDGVRAYWQAEASVATATKPKLGTTQMRLHKLMALVPITDELMEDTSALGSYLPGLMARSIRWKTNEAILLGNGAGQPLGALNSKAAVVVAKDSGQASNTISLGNVSNMIARLPPGSFPRAQWLITPDALPSLFGLQLGNYPIYLPISAGAQGSPYGTLMGRPIMVSQHAAAFSSQGDLMLLDLKEYYRTITKTAGMRTDTSMHLYFDADALAFRTTFRIDGQPKIAQPITQAKGSNQLSPFVQLGAR